MKCGHPDVMANLYWFLDKRNSLGGYWRCRICHGDAVAKYRQTFKGQDAMARATLKSNASKRGNR